MNELIEFPLILLDVQKDFGVSIVPSVTINDEIGRGKLQKIRISALGRILHYQDF